MILAGVRTSRKRTFASLPGKVESLVNASRWACFCLTIARCLQGREELKIFLASCGRRVTCTGIHADAICSTDCSIRALDVSIAHKLFLLTTLHAPKWSINYRGKQLGRGRKTSFHSASTTLPVLFPSCRSGPTLSIPFSSK